MRKGNKKSIWLPIAAAILLIISALFFLRARALAGILPSQNAAERWQGGSETEFCQLSVFLPENEKKSVEDIYSFRSKLIETLDDSLLDNAEENEPCVDAWCAFGQVTALSQKAKGEFSVTAVGGSFFGFHPLRLLSGSYFTDSDLMNDRIILDEESAWMLFGGTELTGMSVNIYGRDFVVAGVVEREDDKFSKSAYDSGMGIYMSYDAYVELGGEDIRKAQEISCYEIVMPQPVKNFAFGVMSDKFPTENGEIVSNTSRFTFDASVLRLRNIAQRSMQKSAIAYPYWENAARAVEDRCTMMYTLFLCFALIPLLLVLYLTVWGAKLFGRKLSEDVAPAAAEKLGEAIRVRQRRRWERRQDRKNRNR